MTASVLYTPAVLGLATGLAAWPWDEALLLKVEARSESCGSTLGVGLALDPDGCIARVALRPRACAIGQAAAAIFAGAAIGRDGVQIADAADAIDAWLRQERDLPDWPGLDAIAAARDYPARRGAVMLAWSAARTLLPTASRSV